MQNLETLKNLLEKPRRIVITSHANPDGDALGSALGLYHYLRSKGHTNVMVVMPTELPDFLDWLPSYKNIVVSEYHIDKTRLAIANAEIVFSLDYNALQRVNEVGEYIKNTKAFKVMIDHHLEPESFADAVLWRTSASSTCELMYDFINLLGDLDSLNQDALTCIYVGLLTDTGGFHYATSPELFRVVADMLQRGVDNNRINDLVFNAYTIKRFKLLSYCINQKLEILDDVNVGIISVSKEEHEEYNIRRGDLEGVVNFILKIKQIRCAIIITERKDQVKLSMRSKGNFSVQEICSKYFEGGGHFNASGGSSKDTFANTTQKLKDILRNEYKEQLTN